MDPRHLVQLSVILEKGSITQASRHLHLTQPTLTHNMQILEMQAGGVLFERSRFGVRSTALGEMLAREGRNIAQTLQSAAEVSARYLGGLQNQLRLGIGPLVGAAILPDLAAALFTQHPSVALTVQSDRPQALLEQLIDKRHDFVVAPSWLERAPRGIERTALIEDELAIFCGNTHPWVVTAQRAGTARDDDELEWLSLGTASPFDRNVRAILNAIGIGTTRTRMTFLGDAQLLLGMLSRGHYLAVLPRFPTRILADRFQLVEINVGAPASPRNIHLWHRSELLEDPTLSSLQAAIVKCARDLQRNAPHVPSVTVSQVG